MPWLADLDVGAVHGFARVLGEARTAAEVRRWALQGLAELVPADVLTWDRVELATGAVRHEVVPSEAEPQGAFETIVGEAVDHPLLLAHAVRRRPALRLSEAVEPAPPVPQRAVRRPAPPIRRRVRDRDRRPRGASRWSSPPSAVPSREFSERDRDVLNLVRPGLEDALRAAEARGRLVRAVAANSPPGTAFVLLDRYGEIEHSNLDAERWLAEHFGAPEHPGWLPRPVAEWLALPPRPALVSVRDGRRLTVHLLPGDPHALLLEEEVTSFRTDALHRLGLTPRETEVLRAATAMEDEADIAWELFLSLHAVRERLAGPWKTSSACAQPPRPSPRRSARACRPYPRRPDGSGCRGVRRERELIVDRAPPTPEQSHNVLRIVRSVFGWATPITRRGTPTDLAMLERIKRLSSSRACA